jgi:hypothetical protein
VVVALESKPVEVETIRKIPVLEVTEALQETAAMAAK